MSTWKPFGKNIVFEPTRKDKVVGDTSKFFLYGIVIAVGDKVENIKAGDIIGYTQWSLNKIIMADKTEVFFCKEDDDFVVGILKNE